MSLPDPMAGMVIRYAYLWRDEHERGLDEGAKDRPCAILLAVTDEAGGRQVVVLPVTHSSPRDPALAVEIPIATRRRLGLDDERSWIVLTEANRFAWLGRDLPPARPGDAASAVRGELPGNLFGTVRQKWLACAASRRRVVTRTE